MTTPLRVQSFAKTTHKTQDNILLMSAVYDKVSNSGTAKWKRFMGQGMAVGRASTPLREHHPPSSTRMCPPTQKLPKPGHI